MSIWKTPLAYPSNLYSSVVFLPIPSLFHSLPLWVLFLPYSLLCFAHLYNNIYIPWLDAHMCSLLFVSIIRQKAHCRGCICFVPCHMLCVEQGISPRHAQYCVKIYKSDGDLGIRLLGWSKSFAWKSSKPRIGAAQGTKIPKKGLTGGNICVY